MKRMTPPMGFNTWNTFGEKISEELIMKTADLMVDLGLKDAGYEYVVIDDCWSLKHRDEKGRLVADPKKFPHGMKYIADYIHSKGLKFGMYSCAGFLTCAGYPASYEYEWIDAKTFAEWEVDYLKYDFCFHPSNVRADILYKRMGLALANCGRNIMFSACSWGDAYTWQWVNETGANLWRSTGDINDSWKSIESIGKSQMKLQEYNKIGCYNDMDMLVVGMNGKGNCGVAGCNFEEYKLHFSLWAMLNSPLMIGCDIREMSDEAKQILLNKDIIAINQDIAGTQAFYVNAHNFAPREERKPYEPFYKEYPDTLPILAKYLDNGDIAIGYFNFGDEEYTSYWQLTIHPENLGLSLSSGKTLELTDLWTGEKYKTVNNNVIIDNIKPHGCRMFRAKVVDIK